MATIKGENLKLDNGLPKLKYRKYSLKECNGEIEFDMIQYRNCNYCQTMYSINYVGNCVNCGARIKKYNFDINRFFSSDFSLNNFRK